MSDSCSAAHARAKKSVAGEAAMKAVILAGGLGTRLSEETVVRPKPMVEIGGKDTLEAFNSALRGARPGQEIKAEVIYPADYSEPKLAGKTVSYEIEVKAIKKRIVPELDDDFAREPRGEQHRRRPSGASALVFRFPGVFFRELSQQLDPRR